MKIAVICTGTELLRGSTVNTNLGCLGRTLTAAGIAPVLEVAVGDRAGEIVYALGAALRQADTVVITGGLGPTSDDITLETVCRFFGVELYKDPELVEKVEACWRRLHSGRCPRIQYKQAMVPVGGEIIPNPAGSASGIAFNCEYAGIMRHIFLAPGPPSEFEPMALNHLVPRISALAGEGRGYVRGFLAAGVGESFASAILEKTLPETRLEVAYTSNFEGTRIYLCGDDAAETDRQITLLRQAYGDSALETGEFALAPALLKMLRQRKLTLSVAESCTGGMAGAAFTAVPGASDVFMGGILSYSNLLKEKLLGVPAEILDGYGAVSSQCAEAMALGACTAAGSDAAIAITGIAGPDGGTEEKPVGLVYVGAAVQGECQVQEWRFRGDRNAVRERAVAKAMLLLRSMLQKKDA